MLAWLQRNQPVSLTGVVTHTMAWIGAFISRAGDKMYLNTHFSPSSGGAGIAIYCIHGTADMVSAFDRIANRIQNLLPETISSIHLVSFEHRGEGLGIDDFAEQLLKKIKLNGDKRVICVGHSRGGIVGSFLAEYLAKKEGIEVIANISIGSPFGGSYLAGIPLSLVSKSIKQMEKGSVFLQNLTEKILTSTTKYIYFAATNDSIVSLDDTHVRAVGHEPIVLRPHGHLSIMSSHRLVRDISDILHQVCPMPVLPSSPRETKRSDISTETKSPIKTDIPDDYVVIEEKLTVEWPDIYYEIDREIDRLKNSFHLKSITSKVDVLTKLQKMLGDMIDEDRENKYSAITTTIETFINAFLEDADVCNGIKPIQILTESLNWSLAIFSHPKPESQIFIENLLTKYRDVPLPKIKKSSSHSVPEEIKSPGIYTSS